LKVNGEKRRREEISTKKGLAIGRLWFLFAGVLGRLADGGIMNSGTEQNCS
jgi:hypothetical protein